MTNEIIVKEESIKDKIYSIRGKQVMLDSDLAKLYGVETKRLNEMVQRNMDRFPGNFMFQLTGEEFNVLRSQIVTLDKEALKCQNGTSNGKALRSQFATSSNEGSKLQNTALSEKILKPQIMTSSKGGRTYLPYAFTEQGIAMLSAVLRSETAVKVSIQIMNAFVSMRKFIASNAVIFQRLDSVERKQIEHDQKFNEIFEAIQSKDIKPDKGIFFEGQIFDAYKFVSDLIRSAKKSITLIDNYVDDSVLTLFSKRDKSVDVVIYTNNFSKQLKLDLDRYNSQYTPIQVKEFKHSHDRFMIIDEKEVYHIGASLKDLGKKWFAFSHFDKSAFKLLERLRS
jgi:hypothetical protein